MVSKTSAKKNAKAKKKQAATAKADAAGVIDTLNGRLADMVDLHWQIKQAHWNVTGLDFIAVHRLFDEQATMAREMADTLAERARGLQGVAEGTIRLAVERSTIDEFPHGLIDAKSAITELVDRYEQLSVAFKNASDEAAESEDKGTEDVYVELLRTIDEQTYFLRSHLK